MPIFLEDYMARVKICGIKRPEDVEIVNELRPDYIGFVFAQESKRYLPFEKAREFRERLDSSIRVVGVFLGVDPKIVASVANQGVIDVIQYHGDEGAGVIERLKAFTDMPVIQAFKVTSKEDVARAVASPAEGILFDPSQGSGKRFDWKLLKGITRPCFLAGGLNPENVGEAIRICHPFCVDVSSGVETDGVKDRDKVEAFIRTVRAAK